NAVKPVPPKTPQLTKNRLELLKKALNSNLGHNLRGVLVFGSTARGQARPDSDLDIMLVCQTTNRHEEEKFLTTLRSQPDCPEIPLPPTPIILDEPDIFAREVSLKFIPFHLLERIGIKVSGAGLDPGKAFIEDYVVVARTPQEAEQIRAKIEAKKAEILKLIQKGSAS
ncbi:MAG: nucleotidyltransferase domain-containing protein, partial [Candidatus Margulisiibacteriota bacterium]